MSDDYSLSVRFWRWNMFLERLSVFGVLCLFLLSFSSLAARENFLLLDAQTGKVMQAIGDDIDMRVSPCSTFKIALSLIGFDMRVLQDEEHPTFPFNEKYYCFLDSWRADQVPSSWMKVSCVWFSQVLAEQLGLENMQSYLDQFQYGNCDLTGDPGKDNGLMRAWLSSSLKISPREAVNFLKKLIRKED